MKQLSYMVLSLGMLACSQVDTEEPVGPSSVSWDSYTSGGGETWEQRAASRVELPVVWSHPGDAVVGFGGTVGNMPFYVAAFTNGTVYAAIHYLVGEALNEPSELYLSTNVGAVSNDTVDRLVVEKVGNDIVFSMSRQFACDWEGCSWYQELGRLPVGTPNPRFNKNIYVVPMFSETSTSVCTGNDSGRAFLFQTPIVDGIQLGDGEQWQPDCVLYQKDGGWRGVVDLMGEGTF